MSASDPDAVTVTFPGVSPAEATLLARELERALAETGVPGEAIEAARTNPEAMDFGASLIILGGGVLLKEFAKGAANEAGHEVVKQLPELVRKAVDRLCQRRRVSAEVAWTSGQTWLFGAEHAGAVPNSGIGAPADVGTLGVVILGASRFPHLEGLDNAAFARSAAKAKALFGSATSVFKRTSVLDLFDQEKTPADIAFAIDRHIDASPDMRDLLIYYCGHGSFLKNQAYFLTLASTRKGFEASTGLKLRDLRHDLEGKLIDRRLYLILDCCYSGEAVKEFMGPSIERAVESETLDALPPYGWTMLAASAPDRQAMAPAGQELTMFTGALAQVLTGEPAGTERRLSFADIAYEAGRYIRLAHGLKAVLPQCYTPRQDAGDLARAALFGQAAAEAPTAAQSVADVGSVETPIARQRPAQRPSVAPPASMPRLGPELPPGAALVLQIGHMGSVESVAFSPDGRLALSGSSDHTVKLWDVASGSLLRTFEGHGALVRSVAFSPDGRRALSGSWDCTLKLWDAATGERLRTFEGHGHGVNSVVFSSDGRRALSGSWDKTLKLWDAASGELVRTLEGHVGSVHSVAISRDGRLALSGSEDKTLKLWDMESGKPLRTLEGHAGRVYSIAISLDGRQVLSGSEDKTLKLWDVASGRLLRTFPGRIQGVKSVALSPDGGWALSTNERDTLKLWDAASGKLRRTFYGHDASVLCVAYSPDGRLALSGSADKTLKLWDGTPNFWDAPLEQFNVMPGRLVRTFHRVGGLMERVAFSPDRRSALFVRDKVLQLRDLATGNLQRTIEGEGRFVNSLAISPNGRHALLGSGDKVLLRDLRRGKLIRTFVGHRNFVRSVAFSPDGRLALSGSADNTLKLWDAASGKLLHSFEGHGGEVECVGFSPDGRLALSGGGDKTLKLRDVTSGKLLRTFDGHHLSVPCAAISPDGRLALSGSWDGTAKLWNAASGALLWTLEGHGGKLSCVAFSPDGRLALSGSVDKTVKLWDVASGELVKTLDGHRAGVLSVAFSPDGRVAFSVSEDSIVKLWDVASATPIATLLTSGAGCLVMAADGRYVCSGDPAEYFGLVCGVELLPMEEFNARYRRKTLAELGWPSW